MADYKPHEIEPKWQAYWEEHKSFRTPDEVDVSRPKFYVLDMFPYPSGAGLHVGHPEGYTATDIIARVKRMRGFNVLHPMGWDAFGLPAERAAVRENAHPAELTKRFIDNFRKQIKRLGFSYDWDREFSTTDEAYYKWTQWIVLKLYDTWYDAEADRGRPIAELAVPADVKAAGEAAVRAFVDGQRLAYQAEVPVNWCPAQGTVLSNEEVQDGKYVETGDPVYRRNMRQWLLRIPRYAERLSRDLADLDWPEPIKEMQRNWIGRSEGAEVDFVVASERSAGGPPAGPSTQQPRTRQPSKPTSTAARKRTRTKVAQPDQPNVTIKGWYARRGIPHFDGGRVPQHVIFRLVDSFPSAKLAQWKKELADLPDDERNDEIRERTEEYLDAGDGESWLKDPRVAEIVQTNLLHFHGERYELHAWAIMPNHVHVLTTPADGHSLPDIVHSWKSFTSKAANKVLGRTGSFWQREYFDRYVRDRAQYETVVAYIEHNPVKARLCKGEADWKWSSAAARVEERGAEAGEGPAGGPPALHRTSSAGARVEERGAESEKGPAGGPPALHRTSSAAARVEERGAESGEGPAGGPPALHRTIRVFTTRPDTLFGATYMVLSPEHTLVRGITTDAQRDAVDAYVEAASRKSDLERTDLAKVKSGVFTGAFAINPVNDARIPIWIADYVLATYGTGAIMAVPGQDERDWEFAKVYDLPIIRTVQPPDGWDETKLYVGEGPAINSDFLNGLAVADAKAKMIAHLEVRGLGVRKVNYKLRDWLFSRQRYWGEPFPLIHVVDDEGNIVETKPVPIDDLPVTLPDMRRFQPTDDGDPPLARAEDWVNTTDPETGKPARRETNTMPQWAGSCWYYLRYIDPRNDRAFVDPAKEKYWMPVDLYVGGAEHAVLHLLYARFWHKVLFDCGMVSTKEPFQQLFNQGLILAYSYKDEAGKYYSPDKVEKREVDGQMRCVVRDTDIELHEQIEKMSKSRYNVTNPDDVIDEFGADSLRLYEMYMGPLDKVKPWRTEDITGMFRFLGRAYRLLTDPATETPALSPKVVDAPPTGDLLRLQHATVKRVTEQIDEFGFNVAIAALIELVNAMYKVGSTGVSPVAPTGSAGKATDAESTSSQDSHSSSGGHGQDAHATGLPRETVETFVRLLAPFAPHLGEELWSILGHTDSITYEPWPTWDDALLAVDSIEIPVQVNGKLRSKITLSAADAADRAKLESIAKGDADVQRHIDGKQIVKVIAVPNKLVNLVVK